MAWSELPMGLLEMIAKRLTTNVDYVRFRAVCMSWRSAVGGRPRHIPLQFPWLMQSYEGDSDIRCFYSLLEDKVYRINMPNSREERCCGSSQGWLAMVGKDPAIRLLNPLTRDEIQLPPMTTFPKVLEFQHAEVGEEYVLEWQRCSVEDARKYFIRKIIMSSSPASSDNCVVMAILYHFGTVVFCRPGDKTWTVLEGPPRIYKDILYCKGQFLTICQDGKLYLCDVGPYPSLEQVGSLPSETGVDEFLVNLNLVELDDELLVVIRYFKVDGKVYNTADFDVYMMDLDSRPVQCDCISLPKWTLFLGEINGSLSYNVDGISGLKDDSIYVTEDYMLETQHRLSSHDFGIYDMENDSIEPLPCYPNGCQNIWPPPTWFTPSLC